MEDLFKMNGTIARSTSNERVKRLLDASAVTSQDDPDSILYQHTVFCQTGMPYRNPGQGVTTWERMNGQVHMAITAGRAMHPEHGKLGPVENQGIPTATACVI